MNHQQLPEAFINEIKGIFADRFSIAQAVLNHHGRDESSYPTVSPQAVVFANSTEEVAELVKLCNQYEIPIVPFGAGTSLEGHLLPIHGGVWP